MINHDDATISIVSNKFIAPLFGYDYSGQTTEALDECTCLTHLNCLINPVADLFWQIKSCERVENKGVGFTAAKVMDAGLDYAKVPVTIQAYAKSQFYYNATGTPSNTNDNRRAAAISSNSEEVSGLKKNDDGTFTLDGKLYPLKEFVPEEIYLEKLPKLFRGACREKKMVISLNTDDKNSNWRENCNRRTLKADATKADTNSEEADYYKTVFSDLTFTVAVAPTRVQFHSALDTSSIL